MSPLLLLPLFAGAASFLTLAIREGNRIHNSDKENS